MPHRGSNPSLADPRQTRLLLTRASLALHRHQPQHHPPLAAAVSLLNNPTLSLTLTLTPNPDPGPNPKPSR
eukprot:scaffold102107_cov45-Phaeocystis_antarctica.AAC.3